uniref:Uncharacterized protein n=1 Tax=Timema bartmani TaxID=61472 RepID=A0A7R9FDY9_9NEOP|nr:unnamed protein product [Timema bartmani]
MQGRSCDLSGMFSSLLCVSTQGPPVLVSSRSRIYPLLSDWVFELFHHRNSSL